MGIIFDGLLITVPDQQKRCCDCLTPFTSRTRKARYCMNCRYERVAKARKAANLAQRTWNGCIPSHRANDSTGMPAYRMIERDADFGDQWDCGACRSIGGLCTLHESMERSGKKPLKYRPYDGVTQ